MDASVGKDELMALNMVKLATYEAVPIADHLASEQPLRAEYQVFLSSPVRLRQSFYGASAPFFAFLLLFVNHPAAHAAVHNEVLPGDESCFIRQ